MQDRSVYEQEYRIRRVDGVYRWFQSRAVSVRGRDGRVIRWAGASTDIDDCKHTHDRLRRAEERLRVSQELSLDGMGILTAVRDGDRIVDFLIEYANPAACRMMQRASDELLGRCLLNVLPGSRLHSDLFARYVRVVETGSPHDIELYYDADCVTGWFRNMAVKLDDGVAVFFSDVSLRRRTEEALRDSESRFRALIGVLGSIVWTTDAEGRFVEPQLSWQDYTGQRPDQYAGYGYLEAVHPDDRQIVISASRESLEHKRTHESHGRLWHAPSAGYRRFVARAVPLLDAAGHVREWIGIVTDVEDRTAAD